MYAMVILVVIVAMVMLRSRVKAIRERKVSIKYFRAMSGAEIPESVQIPARHFSNLFEIPVLFFIVCLASQMMGVAGASMVTLAWIFVGARYVQAFVHLTYNNVLHRMAAYFVGVVTVVTMWTMLVISAT